MADSPALPPDPAAPGDLSHLVLEFLVDQEEPEAPGLEAFLERHPPELRDRLRQECEDALCVQRIVERERPGPRDVQGQALGEFELIREIGRGGMGVVYLAHQPSLNRRVALKVLPAGLTLTDRQVERFRRESRAAARLVHPGIVPVLSVGETDGAHWFAMEFVEGDTLHERLDSRRDAGRHGGEHPLAIGAWAEWVAGIAARLADALHCAHQADVIHRDVKPHNVLLAAGDVPRLVDFGLAKDLGDASLSGPGEMTGTPYYMSPEQALAKRVPVDPRTDVFSLGVVLYEMLTLRRPFEGESGAAVLFAISFRDPEPIRKLEPRVPRDLEIICHKAMEKSPDARYASAAELAADLRRFLNHEAIRAQPPSIASRVGRLLARHRAVGIASAVALLALLVVLFFADRSAGRRALAEQMAPLRELAAEEELEEVELAALVGAREALDRLMPGLSRLDRADRELVLRMEGALGELGRARKVEGLLLCDQATQDGSDLSLYRAQALFLEASLLLPDDLELLRLSDPLGMRPRLAVSSDREGDLVSLTAIDPVTGELGQPEPIGRTPLEGRAVTAGLWRVTVVRPGWGFAELTRHLGRLRHEYRLEAVVRSDEEALEGMVPIEAGPFRFGIPGTDWELYAERDDALPLFFVDEREVSNAQYRAFVLATGHRPAHLWPKDWWEDWKAAWDDLPVVGVSCEDARAYAEWAGKRLPTHREWEKAARGTDGRILPWGESERGTDELAVIGRDNFTEGEETESLEQAFRRYLGVTAEVGSFPDGASPFGILHTLGNAAEWTETPFVRVLPSGPAPVPDQRVVKGKPWDAPPHKWDLSGIDGVLGDALTNTIGFRCAKSAASTIEESHGKDHPAPRGQEDQGQEAQRQR